MSIGTLRDAFEHARDAFVAVDADDRIVAWNTAAERTLRRERGAVLGVPSREVLFSGGALRAGAGEALADPDPGAPVELRAVSGDGAEVPVEVTWFLVNSDAGPLLAFFLRDISDRRRAERYLAAERTATEALSGAIHLDEAAPALLAGLGTALGWPVGILWRRHEATGRLHVDRFWHAPAEAGALELHLELSGVRLAPGEGVAGQVVQDGAPRWHAETAGEPLPDRVGEAMTRLGLHGAIAFPLAPGLIMEFLSYDREIPDAGLLELLDNLAVLVQMFEERVERSREVARLRTLARTDELTGLLNRRGWRDALERELARAQRVDRPLCVLMLDLDGLKQINDSKGHAAGDQALRRLARLLQSHVRGGDVIARLGGDEFGVLLPEFGLRDGHTLVERLRRAGSGLSFSAGLAGWRPGEDADALQARADAELYEDKRDGRETARPLAS